MTDQQPLSLRDAIHDLATTVGATFKSNQFDGGIAYTVTLPGKGSVMVAEEWGDDPQQVLASLRAKMDAAGMLAVRHEFLLDYGSGSTARIWAADKQQAVRIASRGEPETVTDLTTGETVEWVAPA